MSPMCPVSSLTDSSGLRGKFWSTRDFLLRYRAKLAARLTSCTASSSFNTSMSLRHCWTRLVAAVSADWPTLREPCANFLKVVLLTYFSPRCDGAQTWSSRDVRTPTLIDNTLHRAWQASVCLSVSACVHLVSPAMMDTSGAHFLC